MILDYAILYLIIGVLVAIILDMGIRITKTSESFTFIEIFVCIIGWPIMLFGMIKGLFED